MSPLFNAYFLTPFFQKHKKPFFYVIASCVLIFLSFEMEQLLDYSPLADNAEIGIAPPSPTSHVSQPQTQFVSPLYLTPSYNSDYPPLTPIANKKKKSRSSSQLAGATDEPISHCHCGKPSVAFKVKKEGLNYGRTFAKCATLQDNKQCKFFQWEDSAGPLCLACKVPQIRRKDGLGAWCANLNCAIQAARRLEREYISLTFPQELCKCLKPGRISKSKSGKYFRSCGDNSKNEEGIWTSGCADFAWLSVE